MPLLHVFDDTVFMLVSSASQPGKAPFVDDVVIHKAGDFDMLLELDLFAAQIANCVRGARSYDVVLADTTLVHQEMWDLVAYVRSEQFDRLL